MKSEDAGRQVRLSVKRGVDVTGAGAGLVLLSPVLGIVAILVRIRLGRPVLFRQVRPGMNGRMFPLYKFRTMTDARGADGRLLPDAVRLTPLGRFLRRTSLDELPELWNVMKGDMSLVGPRPLLPEYLGSYTLEQARRHDVRPGVTGLAQMNGRNAIPFSERIRLDLEYVDGWSLWLDLRIIVKSLYLVIFCRLYDGAGQDVTKVDDLGLSGRGDLAMIRLPGEDT